MSHEGIYYDLQSDTFVVDGDKVYNNFYMICRNDGTGYYAFDYTDRFNLKTLREKTKSGPMCDLSNEECKDLLALLKEMQRFNIKSGVEQKIVSFMEKLKPPDENGYGYI